jgi:polysaccharide deacetylase family sporulation protein PdaB
MLFFVSKRKLALLTSAMLVLIILAGAHRLQLPNQTRQVMSTILNFSRKVPIYCVQTDQKRIAISFDAAWGADRTDEILGILEEYDVKTTFFLVSFWVERYPEVAALITAAGHEIGNHSATHPHMNSLSAEQIRFELQSTHDLIKETTGQEANLFRPPFGEYNNLVLDTVASLGYHTIQWSIDSLDWKPTTAADITQRVTSKIAPGAIVLFHNNADHTPAALRPILDYCRQEGYEVVPISELLLKGDYYIDKSNGMMRPK